MATIFFGLNMLTKSLFSKMKDSNYLRQYSNEKLYKYYKCVCMSSKKYQHGKG